MQPFFCCIYILVIVLERHLLYESITKFMLDVMLVGEVRTEVRSHLGMSEELLVFALDVLTKIRVVGRVVTDSFRRVFGLEGLETEKVLHSEFEFRFAILAAAAVLIYSYSFFEGRHRIEDRIDDNLTPCEVCA